MAVPRPPKSPATHAEIERLAAVPVEDCEIEAAAEAAATIFVRAAWLGTLA